MPSRSLGTDMLGTCTVLGHPTPAGSCQQGWAEGDQGSPPFTQGSAGESVSGGDWGKGLHV